MVWYPVPVNLYHTPIVPVVDGFGAVSEMAPTVVPAKLDVAQGNAVAPEHASFDGGLYGVVIVEEDTHEL